MREIRWWSVVGILFPILLLVASSCLPGPVPVGTPVPEGRCTAPACGPGETFYCPGDCPGGCGVECATLTPRPPTATHTPSPTPTLRPNCTPPSCAPDEVFYCDDRCPGGCGIRCVTLTPEPVPPPVILSFTADRAAILQGENVQLSWEARDGDEAFICWTGEDGATVCAPPPPDPNGGTVTAAPWDSPIYLTVRNRAGEAQAVIELDVACAYGWVRPLRESPPTDRCPAEPLSGPAVQQPFENGFMIWLSAERAVYVFYEPEGGRATAHFQTYEDEFQEGDRESDPSILPPADLYQPVRQLGLVWRTNPDVREMLGWATAPETPFDTWSQRYRGETVYDLVTLIQGKDGTIYILKDLNDSWEIYAP